MSNRHVFNSSNIIQYYILSMFKSYCSYGQTQESEKYYIMSRFRFKYLQQFLFWMTSSEVDVIDNNIICLAS